MRTNLLLNSPVSLGILRAREFALLAVLVAALGGTQMLFAQTPATSAPTHKPAHRHKRPAVVKVQPPAAQAAAAPATPPAPEVPKWPANEKPAPASVTWDSQGLRIDAANSSLAQILQDVATATGANVEGFGADQRVFGAYGPGPARDVLSLLLQGSGYNVVMIGDQGQGTPRRIVLSSRHAGTATAAVSPAPAPASEEETEAEEPPQPASTSRFGPGGPRRNPPQQQRPQPGQPPNNPPN
jgi:hypothetical protein